MGDYLVDNLSDDDSDGLTPEQETCLIYLFSASVTVFSDKAHRDEDSMTSLTRGLIKLIPVLMRKYKNNFTEDMAKLSEIVRLIRIMDFEMYIKLRMHTVRRIFHGFYVRTYSLQGNV